MKSLKPFKLALLISLILSFTSLLALIACEPYAPILVHNGTGETLWISINDDKPTEVAPYNELKNQTVLMRDPEFSIVAKDGDGKVIYQERFTYDELSWLGWKVLIPYSRTKLTT